MTYSWRRIVATLLAPFRNGYGTCYRCGLPWNAVDSHCTWYRRDVGCSPLCKDCWAELTPAARLPYYRQLWWRWQADTRRLTLDQEARYRWEDIEVAVMAGH